MNEFGPVEIDRAVLHTASNTLCIHAHANQPIDYAAYRTAIQAISDSAASLNGIQKDIRLTNQVQSIEQLQRFCMDALNDRLMGLAGVQAIAIDMDNHIITIGLLRQIKELSAKELTVLDNFKTFISVCFESLIVQFDNPKASNASSGRAQNHVYKTSNAVKKKRTQKKEAFMPGIKRRTIHGEQFKARKLDSISEISLQSGRVAVMGRSLGIESQATRQRDAYVMCFYLSDNQEAILVKWVASPREEKRAMRYLKKGAQVGVRGQVRFDSRYAKENIIWADQITFFDVPGREDTSERKRLELHAHTKMSMDGLADVDQLIATAARFGHPAIAITDHGVVQAYPDAYMAAQKANRDGHNIKLIYGIEAYMANDYAYEGKEARTSEFIVLDIETTGLSPRHHELIEIGAVRVENGKITDSFQTFVKPEKPIPSEIVKLTGIDASMVANAPSAKDALGMLRGFIANLPVCAHNARFDVSFLRNIGQKYGFAFDNGVLDSLTLARMLLPQNSRHSLAALSRHFSVSLENHHRASEDAKATAQIVLSLLDMANVNQMQHLNGIGGTRPLPNHHVVILARNKQGLNALYRLVSASHLNHFYRRPVIPKSLLHKYREHLLVGSACEQGEVYRAVLRGDDDLYLKALANFYDYLEIQPIENNRFLIGDMGAGRFIQDEEDLWRMNERILALGRENDKPVVATGDVHYLDPEDECYRRILMAAQGYENMDEQPPLFLHTTKEMIAAFSRLGENVAQEIVVDAPRRIADMIDDTFAPFPDGTSLPHEEGGEQLVVDIAMRGAMEYYGDPLPLIVENRLKKELESIVKHGFEVLYLSAHRLVKKSMEDGYSVGSRGSVGSSLVAFAMNISEINPLPPHYRCPLCSHVNFDVSHTGAKCGPDLPDMKCPSCGAALVKDGFEIPFEVFLGFDGDKVPDIDLNFSGEYQERAFAIVEDMFGSQNVFRAGTVVGIKEKSAYGYVLKYLEESGQNASRAQIDYFSKGIAGVKRTTGQHPGGLIVLPMGLDIHDFTPLQRPADKQDSPTTTTHFDFNSLHDRLVKLDILGHDNPTMIRRLYEFTDIDPLTVPLDDPDTLSLFRSCEALGLDEKDLGCPTGTLGIPEFGTGFVIEMLVETKPSTIAELLQISGLSHGTDVWIGNAQDLIRKGIATLNECICTRDNIMNYLLSMDVDSRIAFNTMERVRKGRGLTNEMESAMKVANIPAWFIDSCKKIKYMFPKAHAAAYVLSALRIAFFKVHHPLAYYAAYCSVRAEEMDARKVLGDIEALDAFIAEIDKKPNASTRDEKERNHLCLAREMLLRGFSFLPPDLMKSHIERYVIEDGCLRMPLMSIAGLGKSAADSVINARHEREFFTVEDLKQRTKLNTSIIEKLREVGALENLPDTAQMSFFQMM